MVGGLVALPGQHGLRHLDEVGEDDHLLQLERPVRVDPVVHARIVLRLVRRLSLPVRPEHPMHVAGGCLEPIKALHDRSLGHQVLTLCSIEELPWS